MPISGANVMNESTASLFEYCKVPKGDPLLNEVYKLRYKVYCDEWRFEKPEDHPGGMERDDYDSHSLHFYAHAHNSDVLIGTARIILASARFFSRNSRGSRPAFAAIMSM